MTSRILQPTDRPIDARLELPGSKSFANRAIVCAALRGEACTIRNISPADDTAIMLNVLADLGWRVTRSNPLSTEVRLEPPARPVAGPQETQICTGAAGTATRFTCALLTVLPGRFVLDGNARMRQRPMGELIAALRQLGAKIEERGEPGCVPLAIEGASLRGGKCSLRGDISSQFLSALLMVAPTRGGGVEIEIEGELVSKPYVDITLEVMRAFGMHVEREGYRHFWNAADPAASGPEARGPYTVPPDGTAASYFWAAAAVTGGKCVIDGLTRQDVQGDVHFVDLLEQMGCEVLEFPNGLGVSRAMQASPLRAIEADLSALPDCAQTLAVVCAFAEGTSRLTGLSTLRVKETDRIAALQAELAKLGVETRAGADWLEVDGTGNKSPASPTKPGRSRERTSPVSVRTYDDHRMAMSFAIAGLRVPLEIEGSECVSKSFPKFWEYWERLA
ncbi:MAG: 3-phosphoshikimate 1-carboxyvinyltransferase [Planctomycetes bacterium]|nr:3-phosphoshikimate 1-carboxyvinyltransferase [Planctomycetota bacterium]